MTLLGSILPEKTNIVSSNHLQPISLSTSHHGIPTEMKPVVTFEKLNHVHLSRCLISWEQTMKYDWILIMGLGAECFVNFICQILAVMRALE